MSGGKLSALERALSFIRRTDYRRTEAFEAAALKYNNSLVAENARLKKAVPGAGRAAKADELTQRMLECMLHYTIRLKGCAFDDPPNHVVNELIKIDASEFDKKVLGKYKTRTIDTRLRIIKQQIEAGVAVK